jgi:hypothetical protein
MPVFNSAQNHVISSHVLAVLESLGFHFEFGFSREGFLSHGLKRLGVNGGQCPFRG